MTDAAGEMERTIREGDIDHVFVEFPDLNGISRSKRVPADRFLDAWEEGFSMNMTLLATPPTDEWVAALDDRRTDPGYGAAVDYADGTVHPLPGTFARLPWRGDAARTLCDFRFRGESPGAYTRGVLERVVDRFDGVDFRVGTEPEFALLAEADGRREPATGRAYECVTWATESVGDVTDALASWGREYGTGIGTIHHEDGPGQFEVLLDHGPPVDAADRTFDLRRLARRAAGEAGLGATFLTRPFTGGPTNGLHVHVSATRDGESLFGEADLSSEGRAFVGGILDHAPALMALGSPSTNAIKRHRPDGFAPSTRSWGYNNRTAAVRVPEKGATRVENRLPGSEANPYVAVAATIAAGMDGVERGLDPGDPVSGKADGQRPPLPRSPERLLRALEGDEFLVDALGAEFVETFALVRRDELDRFYDHVTGWERRYLDAV